MEATRAPAVSRAPGMPASPVSKPSTFGTFTPSAFYSLPQDNELGNNGRKYSMSPKEERKSFDRFSPTFADIDGILDDADLNTPTASALLLRKLSQSMTQEALNSMLLFASDLIDARFVSQSRLDDSSFQTAVARFSTVDGALEVRTRLNGKANASNDAAMIVEVIKGPAATVDTQHRVSDSSSGRHWSTSASSQGSSGGANKSSRFSSTFQSMDRGSPTKASRAPGTLDLASLPNGPQLPSAFSPTSPTKQLDRRITGKSMISDDAPDEETRELLQNPLAFAEGGRQRQRSLHMPISQISKLTLNTNNEYSLNGTTVVSPSASTFSPNRGSHQPLQSPTSEFSPGFGMSPLSPGVGFPGSPQAYQRFPPANPADQNPPCNTLYVGNLPMDTAEEELKDLFSKQRGYKRLCFRTKHNGPMCFVEFEDVSFATKALHELYGCMLSNSVRSGIRLSFSKNPLGVRTGQSSTNGTGYGGFAAANGPPPGLSMPPGMGNGAPPSDGPQGLSNGVYYTQGSPPHGAFANNNAFQGQGVPHFYGGGARNNFSPIGNALPDLTMRR